LTPRKLIVDSTYETGSQKGGKPHKKRRATDKNLGERGKRKDPPTVSVFREQPPRKGVTPRRKNGAYAKKQKRGEEGSRRDDGRISEKKRLIGRRGGKRNDQKQQYQQPRGPQEGNRVSALRS